jgi:hypothetical protein
MWTHFFFNISSVPSRDKNYTLDNNSKQAVVGAIFNIHSVPIKEQKLYTGRQQQTSWFVGAISNIHLVPSKNKKLYTGRQTANKPLVGAIVIGSWPSGEEGTSTTLSFSLGISCKSASFVCMCPALLEEVYISSRDLV